MKRKKPLQQAGYVLFLLIAIIILFRWHMEGNQARIEEQNKSYAADAAQMKADQIDAELKNALNRVNTYAYFAGESLDSSVVTPQMLEKMEENEVFDAVLYTDADGMDYASDGRTADVKDHIFYQDGIQGASGIEIVFEPHFFEETMACFYAPVYWQGEIVGVLRAAYLAKEYLQDMLDAAYFGEAADVFLCTAEGRVIAASDNRTYDGNLVAILTEEGVIDENTASNVKAVFENKDENGGKGTFLCDSHSKTDKWGDGRFPCWKR